MSRFVNPVPQFYLNNGDIASAGKLYFYETGTTTKKDTYSDFGQSVKNTNPVILSGEGRCPNIFGEGRYTVVFKDKDDIEQWTRDDVELSVEIGQYADWSPILTYRINDIVRGSDGEYYRSITSTNTGNDPTTSATNWEEIAFISEWNTNATYQTGDNVFLDGLLYISEIADNTGNQPDSSSTDVWADAAQPRDWLSARTYQTNDVVIYQGALYRSAINNNSATTPGTNNDWLNLSDQKERITLTGSSTTISAGFNNTYWYDGIGDHTLTIDEQSSDEGAVETKIVCEPDASGNIVLASLGVVDIQWSFGGGSAVGYEIKPGETVRLLSTGAEDLYQAYADNGISEVVELGGGFGAGETATVTRVGDQVCVTADQTLTHASSSGVSSAAGIIPSIFRPPVAASDVYNFEPSLGIQRVRVEADGTLSTRYVDFTGANDNATTSFQPPKIAYNT